jgi:hypothetical protein
MPSPVQLIEVPGGPWPVERFLYADFYDGPVDGFVRCPGLGHATGLSPEFVCGPALREFYVLCWYDRPFLATQISDGVCERLREWTSKQTSPNYLKDQLDIWSRPLPLDLDGLYQRFNDEAAVQGELVIRFGDQFSTLQAWHAVNNQVLTQDMIEAIWPGPPASDFG